MAAWATGMAMPVVCGPMLSMNAAKRSTKAKPEKKEGGGFFDQLGEWTQKSSLNETDPILKKVADQKKDPVSAAPEKKRLFGF